MSQSSTARGGAGRASERAGMVQVWVGRKVYCFARQLLLRRSQAEQLGSLWQGLITPFPLQGQECIPGRGLPSLAPAP